MPQIWNNPGFFFFYFSTLLLEKLVSDINSINSLDL